MINVQSAVNLGQATIDAVGPAIASAAEAVAPVAADIAKEVAITTAKMIAINVLAILVIPPVVAATVSLAEAACSEIKRGYVNTINYLHEQVA